MRAPSSSWPPACWTDGRKSPVYNQHHDPLRVEFDSLADVIALLRGPRGFMVYAWALEPFGRMGSECVLPLRGLAGPPPGPGQPHREAHGRAVFSAASPPPPPPGRIGHRGFLV